MSSAERINCPTCDKALRPIQVETMIGNPDYSEWCRNGYCSLECFAGKDPAYKPVEMSERHTAPASPRDSEITVPGSIPPYQIFSGAGFWTRAIARMIDMAFGGVLGLIGGAMGGIALAILQNAGSVAPGWEQRIQGMSAAGFFISLLGSFLYHSICEGIHGATLGKVTCGLRVLRQDGGPTSMKGALMRNLGWYVDSLFFGLVALHSMQTSSLQQRYGDVWGKTIVVKTRHLPSSHPRSPLRFTLGVFIGAMCWTLLLAIGVVLKAG